jgi:2'-5' RNA ligase
MNMESPRLFIAVPIDERWREKLTRQCTSLKSKLPFQKWTDPEDYHITLKFLGDTASAQIQQLERLVESITKATAPFELTEKGWGTFGPHAAPSILWAGVGGDISSLNNLHRIVEISMADLGFPQENRSFHPHVTLARRYKGKTPLMTPIKQLLPEPEGQPIEWSVKEIKLYQSHLQKRPMYEAISTFKLCD